VVTDPRRPPTEWRDRYDIEVVPPQVLFGSETSDGVDMTNEQFFASSRWRQAARPRPLRRRVREVYSRLAKDHDNCISIYTAAAVGDSGSGACRAQSVEGFTVNVIDSETVTMPMAFLAGRQRSARPSTRQPRQ
jgi:fatty acid-binding protein DegV